MGWFDHGGNLLPERNTLRLISQHVAPSIIWNKARGNYVLIGIMKKLLLGCLIFITACQSATPAPTLLSTTTATILSTRTPIPVTNTPVPTATLALSPTPLPRFFTNEFDLPMEGWSILEAGSDFVPNIKSENSSLILQIDSVYSWVYAVYGTQDYADVHVETRFENRAGSPASVGLLCRYSEENGWFEYNVTTDGAYNLLYGRWLSVGVADYLPITDGSSNLVQPSGAAQQIGMNCSGTTVTLSINGTVIRSSDVSRYELPSGNIGITVASYENTPILTALDWVNVSESP